MTVTKGLPSLEDVQAKYDSYVDTRLKGAHVIDTAAALDVERAFDAYTTANTLLLAKGDTRLASEEREFEANLAALEKMKPWIEQIRTDRQPVGKTSPRRSTQGGSWAATVAEKLTRAAGEAGVKAITTGGIDVPSVAAGDGIVRKTAEAARVLDLITDRKDLAGNAFAFLRQTVRTNNAAPVADEDLKPTSVYTVEEVEGRARVFAHLSEPIPQRYFTDSNELEDLLRTQMEEDLMFALEADILNGDNTGEHFQGLVNTAGIRTQAYSSSVLTTLRKGRTTLQTAGETPTAWVLNPTDLETLDLTRAGGSTTTDGPFLEGIDEKIFGNLPKVASTAVAAGTAWLGDWNYIRLYVAEAARLDADMSGENFTHNLVTLRYEGRYGLAVRRPAAFVLFDLTA